MTAEVEPDSPSQLELGIPEEPLELKALLRAAVGEDPVAGREVALANVTKLLWDEWGASLAASGVGEERFASIVVGATNEVWLWVMGDRPYDQLVATLAGRTIRRTA
jgi:hypothetical protein